MKFQGIDGQLTSESQIDRHRNEEDGNEEDGNAEDRDEEDRD